MRRNLLLSLVLVAACIACPAAFAEPAAKAPAPSEAALDALEKKIEGLIDEVRTLRAETSGAAMQTWTVTFEKLGLQWLAKAVTPIIEGQGGSVRIDADGKSLIIEAPRARMPAVRQFIFKLELELTGGATDGQERYILKHTKAADAVATLERLLAAGKVEAKVTADERTQSVIVEGSRAARDRVGQLIAEVDRAKADTQIMTMYALKTVQAAAIADALLALIDDKQTKIGYDSRTNVIILHATPARTAQVRQLLSALDGVKKTSAAPAREKWSMATALGDAKLLAKALLPIIDELGGSVRADDADKMLTIEAPAAHLPCIKRLVTRMYRMPSDDDSDCAKDAVIKLRHVDAKVMSDLLNGLLKGFVCGPLEGFEAKVDVQKQTVTVPVAGRDVAGPLIFELDRQWPAGSFTLFRLGNADAREAAETIRVFMGEFEDVFVICEQRSNAIILHAPADRTAEVTKMIAALDGQAADGEKSK